MVACRQQCIKIHWVVFFFFFHRVNEIHSLLNFFFPQTNHFIDLNCFSTLRDWCNFRCLCCLFHSLEYYYIFLPFVQFMGFLKQVYWSSLLVPPPVDHPMTCLSWVPCMVWLIVLLNYTSLCHDKTVIHERKGQGNLVCCSPGCGNESDTTWWLNNILWYYTCSRLWGKIISA